MHSYIVRYLYDKILSDINSFPVTALLGPRQCGKSTLAKHVINNIKNTVYLDLERATDLNKLNEPELFFNNNKDKLICIDEIQLKPEIFNEIRWFVDQTNRPGQFLILGSASRELINQSSESLAGRIVYEELTPFLYNEIKTEYITINDHLLKGGYPGSLLTGKHNLSIQWRENFIRTFIERDIPKFGFKRNTIVLNRFLNMCAHVNGQVLNKSKLGESLGLSHNTISDYIDLYEQTFIIRTLKPYYTNLKKRIIKSPKIYFRDTGILHSILKIDTFNDLLGHPVFGSSWEAYCIENILNIFDRWDSSYYRTSNGTEIDLILQKGNKKIAVEFKASTAPKLSKGFYNSLIDLEINKAWVVSLSNDTYEIKKGVIVTNLNDFLSNQF